MIYTHYEAPRSGDEYPKVITLTHQAAEFLSLAVQSIYQMVSRRELPYMKRSKRIYFSRTELMEYLKKGRKPTVSEIQKEADKSLIERGEE